MNVRLMAEFLVKRPRQDFSAQRFQWKRPKGTAANKLFRKTDGIPDPECLWVMASQHLVHYGMDRIVTPANYTPPSNIGDQLLEAGTAVFDVAGDFVSHLEDNPHLTLVGYEQSRRTFDRTWQTG